MKNNLYDGDELLVSDRIRSDIVKQRIRVGIERLVPDIPLENLTLTGLDTTHDINKNINKFSMEFKILRTPYFLRIQYDNAPGELTVAYHIRDNHDIMHDGVSTTKIEKDVNNDMYRDIVHLLCDLDIFEKYIDNPLYSDGSLTLR